MKSYDQVQPQSPLDNMEGDEPLTLQDNNHQAVDEMYRDALTEWEWRISGLKRDVTEEWMPGQKERLQLLLSAYRAAWETLERGK